MIYFTIVHIVSFTSLSKILSLCDACGALWRNVTKELNFGLKCVTSPERSGRSDWLTGRQRRRSRRRRRLSGDMLRWCGVILLRIYLS